MAPDDALLNSWPVKEYVDGLSFSPDGRYVLTAGFNKQVCVWDLATEQMIRQFSTGVNYGLACWKAVLSSTGIVAAGFGDFSLHLWEMSSGKELRRLVGHEGIVTSLEFSADGTRLVTGCCVTLHFWDVATGNELACVKTKKSATRHVSLAPDGKTAVSGAGDKLVHVWDMAGGVKEVGALVGHESKINGVAFFADGKRVASASSDKTVRIWNIESGKEIATLSGHKKAVNDVAVASDGATVASCGKDGLVILWDVRKSEERSRYDAAKGTNAIAFAPDNASIVVGGNDCILRHFRV